MKNKKSKLLAAASLCTVALCSTTFMACGTFKADKKTDNTGNTTDKKDEIVQQEKLTLNISSSQDLNNFLLMPKESYADKDVKLNSDIDFKYSEIVLSNDDRISDIDFGDYKINNAIIWNEDTNEILKFYENNSEHFENCYLGEYLTQDQIVDKTFDTTGVAYYLSEDFTDFEIVTETGLNLIFDGTNAHFTGHSIFNFGKNRGSIDISIVKENQVERQGCYIVRNFNSSSRVGKDGKNTGNLSVGGTNTELRVLDNEVPAIDLIGNNTKFVVDNNKVDSHNASYIRGDGNSSDYGIFVYGFAYDLTFTNNEIKNVYGHAFAILGYQAQEKVFELGKYYENVISEFSGNTITVSNGETKPKRATVKIWDDKTFADKNNTTVLNDNAKELINRILAKENHNTLRTEKEDAYLFSIYNVNCNDANV